jgi:hypothetical protein
MSTVLFLAIGAVLAALAFWLLRGSRWLGGGGGKKASAGGLRKRIHKMVSDPEVADRLIEGERERHPELGEVALLKKVIRRLERDKRR